jgi:protocatechuate 3,4-dioxygenase beta subunit
MKRSDFIKKSGIASLGFGLAINSKAEKAELSEKYPDNLPAAPPICILAPAETFGPFPSTPSGESYYWRNNLIDGQAGVVLNLTIKIFGTGNCGIMQNQRVDIWHCNANGFYSHYAASGMNNGHSGQNNPGAGNASLIYGRGSQVTDANGVAGFTTVFPGWYPGRTMHIHYAVYSGGTAGSNSGWVQQQVSQFTFPITAKNTLLTTNSPYSTYGADPLHPDSDNVFMLPAGEWANTQLATLVGSGTGPYSSYYEAAVAGTGVLSLKLVGFAGSLYGQSCLLRWRTESESNFSHFELEYSKDADDFDFLARVESRGNDLIGFNDYLYEDKDRLIHGNAFYRLKMVDKDGKFVYSAIVAIHNHYQLPIKIRPVPATDHIILYHPLTTGTEKVMITDGAGRAIGVGTLDANANYTRINLNLFGKGVHFLIYADGRYNQTLKFIIQ